VIYIIKANYCWRGNRRTGRGVADAARARSELRRRCCRVLLIPFKFFFASLLYNEARRAGGHVDERA
jgi:hypothetical protein